MEEVKKETETSKDESISIKKESKHIVLEVDGKEISRLVVDTVK